ncbi:hypothetical protein M9978_21510 [Sphingomonas sp. MG17]|uniref:Uncharacterized protein n=1 Tax=Sphingomonas tagetis TaxID=2949092 RepID=A0A9X2HRC8_9SPHN|nr:hypothetical protein [Sphingomonas tagetis]MCP3732996.1 hypothetical protein [Sphingomonas tagetis]
MESVAEWAAPKASGRRGWLWLIPLPICAAFYFFCGFYTVQPIGALPDGATAIVWRESGEPFFNSADALCLERVGYVSLLCRGMAMGRGPTDRIIVRLPYMDWAYSLSTGGQSFDR